MRPRASERDPLGTVVSRPHARDGGEPYDRAVGADEACAEALGALGLRLCAARTLVEVAEGAVEALVRLVPGRGVHVQLWPRAERGRVVEASGGPEMSAELAGEPLLAPSGPAGEIVVDARALDACGRARIAAVARAIAGAAERVLELEAYAGTERELSLAVAALAEARGGASAAATERVAQLCAAIARELVPAPGPGFAERIALAVRWASARELVLPDALLLARRPLASAERALARASTERAADALAADARPGSATLALARELLLHEDERFDGSGPLGLAGDDVALGARIVAVARAWFEACGATTRERALERLHAEAGTRHDPRVVEALERTLPR